MFLKVGLLSLLLLLSSRLLGLARESAQAAAFGTSGLGDIAVLMLSLPDWLAGVFASGALAYVLLPQWARETHDEQSASQRRVAHVVLAGGIALGLLLWFLRTGLVGLLAAGVPAALQERAAQALGWSAVALPAALLAALWATRLQHLRDFAGMYGANLVISGVLVLALVWIASGDRSATGLTLLGLCLLLGMGLRLIWLRWRYLRATPAMALGQATGVPTSLPRVSVWLWAVLSAGLPPALPFVARSMASGGGEGALATFNYAWKLVELPLLLAIQLVASLAFPAITRAFAEMQGEGQHRSEPVVHAVRSAFALAWTLACAAVAGLLVGAPAVAQLLFGWGRMGPEALTQVAAWGATGAWGLIPQALIAVALSVLATQGRMRWAAGAWLAALIILLAASGWAGGDGARLMVLLNVLLAGVAVVTVLALGPAARYWLPLRLMATTGGGLLIWAGVLAAGWVQMPVGRGLDGLVWAIGAATACIVLAWLAGPDLKRALRR